MNVRTLAVMVSVVLLALPGALCAQEPDPMVTVDAWLAALNAGDIDGALSYVADGAVVTIVPPSPGTSGVFSGKDDIRGWYEAIVGEHGQTTLTDCRVDGESVTCVNTYTADSVTAMGLDALVAEWVAEVRDGLLQTYSWTITEESLAELMAAMPPETMAETGGTGAPLYVAVALVGGLLCIGGLCLGGLRWRQSRLG